MTLGELAIEAADRLSDIGFIEGVVRTSEN